MDKQRMTNEQVVQMKRKLLRPHRTRNALVSGSLFTFCALVFVYSAYKTSPDNFDK